MSTALQPHGNIIVAAAEKVATKTPSGLYIPEKATKQPATVKVIAIGPEVTRVKVGDRIVCKSFSKTEEQVDDEDYVFIEEKDVLATIK